VPFLTIHFQSYPTLRLFPFFKLQIALLSSEADMRKSRQENDLNLFQDLQFRQQIIDKLDTFQSNNQKEYWNLVNSLRESKRDNPEKKY
jgi:hypothetical protein